MAKSPNWTKHEISTLERMLSQDRSQSAIAKKLDRSEVGVQLKALRLGLQSARRRRLTRSTKATRWGNQDGRGGSGVIWWTYDRIMEALKAHVKNSTGTLPSTHGSFSEFCRGIEIPTAIAVRRHFFRFGDAWLAAGAARDRITFTGTPWTVADENLLIGLAGDQTRVQVAARLRRSDASVKRRAYDLGVMFRHNAGNISATELANRLGCDAGRIYAAISSGILPAHKIPGVHNRWEIEVEDIPESLARQLTRPSQKKAPRRWSHDEVERLIKLRKSGRTWMSIGRSLGRNYNGCLYRYRRAVALDPLWRAVWHTVRELGGADISIVDVERVMKSRGYNVTYSSIRAVSIGHPRNLQVSRALVSWVRWTSRRVRPTSESGEYLGARAS